MITYGLIGEKLGHSFSPLIHKRIFGYEYTLKELDLLDVHGFLMKKEFKGINVTVPYKELVMQDCSEIDPVAREIGAVNTIINRNGKLIGYNTDWYGMEYTLTGLCGTLKGKIVVILGTGGTSKTANYVAKKQGATGVYMVSRNPKCGQISYEELYLLPRVDVIYNPLRTKLILDALARGIKCTNGLSMLVAQAKMAGELFTNKKLPLCIIEKNTAYIRDKQSNIVLIGMPGSGKTRIGTLVGAFCKKKVVDTDKTLIANVGMKIPEIFEKQGEMKFREYEYQAIHGIYQQKNLVISTGGGSIKLRGNMDKLRQNGVVVYIRCETQKLSKKGRPLSQSGNIEDLFQNRKCLYERYADITIDNDDTVAKCAEKIKKGYYEYNSGEWA